MFLCVSAHIPGEVWQQIPQRHLLLPSVPILPSLTLFPPSPFPFFNPFLSLHFGHPPLHPFSSIFFPACTGNLTVTHLLGMVFIDSSEQSLTASSFWGKRTNTAPEATCICGCGLDWETMRTDQPFNSYIYYWMSHLGGLPSNFPPTWISTHKPFSRHMITVAQYCNAYYLFNCGFHCEHGSGKSGG